MSANNTTLAGGCPANPYLTWSLRLAYSTIFILGLFGNAVVCWTILKRKQLQSSIGMFTFNLAFHDLLLVILYVPTQMIALENCYSWILGDFMCHLVYIILPLSLSVSIGTLLAITGDRFRVIVFPVKQKLTKTTVKLIVAAIWLVSVVTALPLVFVIKIVSPNPNIKYCLEVWPVDLYMASYWVAMFVFQYLLPLTIIAVLAGMTAHSLRKNSLPGAMESCEKSEFFRKNMRKRVKQTQKITKMLIALVLLYAVCMLPQHVVYTFWTRYGNLKEKSYREQANIVANIFPIANSALNAIAYGTLNKDFKAVFKSLFSCACCKMDRRGSVFRGNNEHSASKVEGLTLTPQRSGPLLQQWKRSAGQAIVTSGPEVKLNVNNKGFIREPKSVKPENQAQTCFIEENDNSIESWRDDGNLRLIPQEDKFPSEKNENGIESVHKKETTV